MNALGRAVSTLRTEGVRSTAWRSAKYLTNRFGPRWLNYIKALAGPPWMRRLAYSAGCYAQLIGKLWQKKEF